MGGVCITRTTGNQIELVNGISMTIDGIAKTLEALRQRKREIEEQANFLIKCGLDREANKLRENLPKINAQIEEVKAEFDCAQSQIKADMFQMLMACDIAYNKSITFSQTLDRYGYKDTSLSEEMCKLVECCHDIVGSIDDYGMDKFSDEYARCTDELDELYDAHIEPLIAEIYNRHREAMIVAYEASERRKERK